MTIFTDRLVEEMARLPGGRHCFLRQLCLPEGEDLRGDIEQLLHTVDEPAVHERIADRLRSLDNRRFFQGFAELGSLIRLKMSGWQVSGLDGGGLIGLTRPDGHAARLLVLSFIDSTRPVEDRAEILRLEKALSRVHSPLRFTVFVRKWLPPGFDPEPVRQAVQIWLSQIESGRWESRFAAYEDENVALEFGLVGDADAPARVQDEQSPVVFTVGPFTTSRSMAVVEHRVISELERVRPAAHGAPLLVSVVADKPWRISRGYWREFLYGKPAWVATSADPLELPWQAALSKEQEPCLFKDTLYTGVAGVMLLGRDPEAPSILDGLAASNPFATAPLSPDELDLPVAAVDRWEDELPIIRWFNRGDH